MEWDIRETVWLYGYEVGRREKLARLDYRRFQSVNELCLGLWQILIDADCYQDAGNSQLKPEFKPFYYAGLNNEPYDEELDNILNMDNWQRR